MEDKDIREVFRKLELLDESDEDRASRHRNRWVDAGEKPVYWLVADSSSAFDAIERLNGELKDARLERLTK